jgi:hypothetical protein
MPGIKAVYQLEQEFDPYLTVDFIPNRENPPGVLLIAGNEVIRRNYTFDDPNDIIEMRKLIWKYLKKYHRINNIEEDNRGPLCIKDFKKTETNRVIQGWANKKRNLQKGVCCKGELHAKNNNKTPEFVSHFIKHPLYRYDGRDMQNKRLCLKNRYAECGNNFPPNTMQHKRCTDEVRWLCENGYPRNIRTEIVENYAKKTRDDLLKKLKENKTLVDRRAFDNLKFAGLFERPVNRAGNKFSYVGKNSFARPINMLQGSNIYDGPRTSSINGGTGISSINGGTGTSNIVEGFNSVMGPFGQANKIMLMFILVIILLLLK